MGEIHRRGLLGMPVDESQARRSYEKAAEAGHGSAIFLRNNWRNRDHFV
jgi:TPR repeat protein